MSAKKIKGKINEKTASTGIGEWRTGTRRFIFDKPAQQQPVYCDLPGALAMQLPSHMTQKPQQRKRKRFQTTWTW